MLYESLAGQCEYTAQPKGSFLCHAIDVNGAVLVYWTFGLGQKGLSVVLSGIFLEICSLVFSGMQHGVRHSCGVVHDRIGFFEDNILFPKHGGNRTYLGLFECIIKI